MGYIKFMYSKTTNGVTVTVTPYFLDDQSSPQESHFVWAYQVNIKNSGNSSIKLNHRNWLIIDANGKVINCLLYTSPSPRDMRRSRMPSSA